MTHTDLTEPSVGQPRTEVIESLCSAIQRQAAVCGELVMRAVELEREECAKLAEEAAQRLRALSDVHGSQAANRVAEQIRARTPEGAVVVTRSLGVGG